MSLEVEGGKEGLVPASSFQAPPIHHADQTYLHIFAIDL